MESVKKWLGAVGILAYGALAWFSGIWLKLTRNELWILRLGLLAIGLAGIGAILLWLRSRRAGGKAAEGAAGPVAAPSQGEDDLDFLVRVADTRLRSSKLSIGGLPAILVMGEPGSGKTTAILKSGLDPDQVAGQVVQDDAVVPTRPIIVWFARQTVFVEAGGTLLAEPARWARLVRRLAPGKLQSVLGGKNQAPRAALVCFDCGTLLERQAAATTVRVLHARLAELSQALGISLPVYALFNKMDRLPFFTEYFSHLTHEEAGEVLGVTLPIQAPYNVGVYADQESKRLTAAFDELFYSLSDKRIEYMTRASAEEKLPGIYEFPREFRKVRNLLVQTLVDLCRPSQLTVSPFLRGFYFAGRRTVVVEAIASLSGEGVLSARTEPTEATIGATRMFDPRQLKRAGAEPPPDSTVGATRIFNARKLAGESNLVEGVRTQGARTREVQEWMFLSRLFGDVLLQDRAAFGASGSSTKINFLRRLLLTSAAALLLAWIAALVVSYSRNRTLLSQVGEAQAATFSEPLASQAPSLSDLQRLKEIGQLFDTLSAYRRDGAPLSLRWGLYVGDDLYPAACRAYARAFGKLLLGPTQAAMVATLKGLVFKAPYDPSYDPYDGPYNILETYLITTGDSSHAREDPTLSSDLYKYWSAGRTAGTDQGALAKGQFESYSVQLATAGAEGCLSAPRDTGAVQTARRYLNSFPADQRIYQAMLAETASKVGKGIDFNRQFADQLVTDSFIVRPAFTRDGWTAMQSALKNLGRYGGAAGWVLGEQAQRILDPQAYEAALREHYQKDFVSEWRSFIKAARFKSTSDIAQKVDIVAGAHSALLMVLCLASKHTAVDDANVAGAFNVPRAFVPADCETKVLGPANKDYTDSLYNLQSCLQKANLQQAPQDKAAARVACQPAALDASNGVRRQVAQNAGADHDVNIAAQTLLLDPIDALQGQMKAPPPPGAGDLCSALKMLSARFPGDATLADFQSVFGPDGLLGKFKPPAEKANPQYVSFYNNAGAIQRALYPDGKTLQLRYTITALPSSGVNSFSLTIGAQTLNAFGTPRNFVWRGDAQESVQLVANNNAPVGQSGTFNIFKFVAVNADPGQLSGQKYIFPIPVVVGRQLPTSPRLRLSIDAGAATLLFQSGSLARLGCTARVGQ